MTSFFGIDTTDRAETQKTPTRRASIFVQDTPSEVLEFDASVSETHSGDATVTDHPVEEGGDITDHVRRSPESIQINGIVSNHPIIAAVDDELNAQPSVPDGDPSSRAEDAYDFLRKGKDAGTVWGLSTTLRDYSNMVITALSVVRDKDTGNIVDVNLTAREIIIAQTETVDVPEPEQPERKKKQKLGKKNKPATSPATETKTKSLGVRIFSALGESNPVGF